MTPRATIDALMAGKSLNGSSFLVWLSSVRELEGACYPENTSM